MCSMLSKCFPNRCGVLLSAAALVFSSLHSYSATEKSAAPKARTILFVDDHDVLYRSGTKRVLVPLKRHSANPIIKGRDKPWEVDVAWTSIYRNPTNGLYQLWFQAFAGDEAHDKTRRCTVSYAESTD